MSQNWKNEPYARAAYLEDNAMTWITNEMSKSIDDKLYFAEVTQLLGLSSVRGRALSS